MQLLTVYLLLYSNGCDGEVSCHLGSTILSSQVGLSKTMSQSLLEEPVEISFPMEVSTDCISLFSGAFVVEASVWFNTS